LIVYSLDTQQYGLNLSNWVIFPIFVLLANHLYYDCKVFYPSIG